MARYAFTIHGVIDVADPNELAAAVGMVDAIGADDAGTVTHGRATPEIALMALLTVGLRPAFANKVGPVRIEGTSVDVTPLPDQRLN